MYKKGSKLDEAVADPLDESDLFDCDLSPDDFRDLTAEHKPLKPPSWPTDDLVCNPAEAAEYREHIRRLAECPDMPDNIIRKSIMTVRRH